MDRRTRDQLKAIEDEGFVVKRTVVQGNSHMRAYVDTPLGERFITIACSPSRGGAGGAFVARRKCRILKRSLEQANKEG